MSKDKSYLTPLTGKIKRKKFLVVDIESKKDDTQEAGFTRPFMVGVYDGETYRSFRNDPSDHGWSSAYFLDGGCVDKALRYILRAKYLGYHIYAHNGGRFDYLHFMPWLMHVGVKLGFSFNAVPVSSSIQILDIFKIKSTPHHKQKRHRKTFRFLDSVRLIPMKLDKAAKSFGLEGKLEHDLHMDELEPKWDEYLKQDCVQLYEVMVKFHDYVENVLCGQVGVTTPSTAMQLFRRKYLKEDISRDIETHDFVRNAYFGGRVEVYKTEGEKLRYYDFNSSYPASMLKAMPAGGAIEWGAREAPLRLRQDYIGFVEADVYVPETLNIPPLPIRFGQLPTKILNLEAGKTISNKKLVFPVGKLRGTWEWEELQMAVEFGVKIVNWRRSIWYEPKFMFVEYVHDLYAYRDKSRSEYDVGLAMIAKLMLNATYGKFGQKPTRKKIHMWNDPDLPGDATPATRDPFECSVYYSDEESDAEYIIPHIAARVTAIGRVKLYREAIKAAERAGGEVYYVDTDSALTTAYLESSTELGALKDEFPEESGELSGKFLAPKVYYLEGPKDFEYVKAKGVQNPTKAAIEAMSKGWTSFSERLEKVGSLAQVGFSRGPQTYTAPKRFLGDTGKRKMLPDGSTEPWVLDMWSAEEEL